MKLPLQLALAGVFAATVPTVAAAKIISMDIHAEFGLDRWSLGHMVLAATGVSPASPGPHLGAGHVVGNADYIGRTEVTLDADVQTIFLAAFDFYPDLPIEGVNGADYYFIRVSISNIVFDVDGEFISGLEVLEDAILFQHSDYPYLTDFTFTDNSIMLEWVGEDSGVEGSSRVYLTEGGTSLFRYTTSIREQQDPVDVPAPLSLSLMGAGLAGLAVARRRRG